MPIFILLSKLYPYPVLAWFNDDYINSHFNIEVDVAKTPSKIELNAKVDLIDEGIKSLILNNYAKYCLHIECPLTSYRQMVLFNEVEKIIEISSDKIEGVVNICPFVIATQNIVQYKNANFNKIYTGYT